MANTSPITLQQLFRFYRGLPHQAAAIVQLEEDIRSLGYGAAMRRDRPWFAAWSQDGKQPQPPAARPTNPLTGFPWFPQTDNGPEGWRQCQTSSIAMCLAYLGVAGIRDDTDYLQVVQRHGDTTSQAAHQAALKELGVRARFTQNCSASEVQAEIRAGLQRNVGIILAMILVAVCIFYWMITRSVILESFTARATLFRLPLISVIPAEAIATSVPVPIAIPTSA